MKKAILFLVLSVATIFANAQTTRYVVENGTGNTKKLIHHFLLKTFLFSAFAVEKNIVPLHSVKFKWRFAMYYYQKLGTFESISEKNNERSQECGQAYWIYGFPNTLITDKVKSAILFLKSVKKK